MDLNFEIFMIVLLVLSILVVGNFLRDGESNWLEGALLVVCSNSRFLVTRCEADVSRLLTQSSLLRAGIIPTLTWQHPTVLKVQKWSMSL